MVNSPWLQPALGNGRATLSHSMCPEIKLVPWNEEPSLEAVQGGGGELCAGLQEGMRGCFDVCATLDVCSHTCTVGSSCSWLPQLPAVMDMLQQGAHMSHRTGVGRGRSPFTAKRASFSPSAASPQVCKHRAMIGYRCTSCGQN